VLPEIVALGPAHPPRPQDLDLLDPRGVERKRSLHPHPMGNAPDGEGLARPPAAAPDHDSLERLEPVAPAFGDFDMHPHGVSRPKRWHVGLDLRLLDGGDSVHRGPHPIAIAHYNMTAAVLTTTPSIARIAAGNLLSLPSQVF